MTGATPRQTVLWTAIMVVGGACMAVQSRVNGELGLRLDHGMLAALISFGSGLVILAVIAALSPALRAALRRLVDALRTGSLPWGYTMTGLIGAFFVASQGIAAGVTGVALFTVGVVAGQTISALAVDRIGIRGLAVKPITVPRVAGAAIALGAVALAVVARGGTPSWLLLLPFAAGLLQSLQQAMGGVVQRAAGSALAQATSNFLVGTAALAAIVGVQALAGQAAEPLPTEPLLYIGGALGITFIALGSIAVHHLGVLALSLSTICGQVLGSLALDALLPVHGQGIGWPSVVAAGLTIVAVLVTAIRRPRRR